MSAQLPAPFGAIVDLLDAAGRAVTAVQKMGEPASPQPSAPVAAPDHTHRTEHCDGCDDTLRFNLNVAQLLADGGTVASCPACRTLRVFTLKSAPVS